MISDTDVIMSVLTYFLLKQTKEEVVVAPLIE